MVQNGLLNDGRMDQMLINSVGTNKKKNLTPQTLVLLSWIQVRLDLLHNIFMQTPWMPLRILKRSWSIENDYGK